MAAASIALNRMSRGTRRILFDVSVIIKKDIRTGIERVTRSLLKQLLLNPPEGYCVEPVYFKDGRGFSAPNFAMAMIERQDIVFQDEIIEPSRGDIFLAIQLAAGIISENEVLLDDWSRRGVKIYFMVHDLLPALRPDVFPDDGTEEVFERWLHIISRVSTGLVCASRAVADELAQWFRTTPPKRHMPLRIGYSHHGADLAASIPTSGIPEDAPMVLAELSARPSLLMVGTIEPRKGHVQAVDAFDHLWREGVDSNLVIVGYEGWKGVAASHRKYIIQMVERLRLHPQSGKRLFWLEGISDEYLEKIYASCTALLFASEGEGFGLPLIEAAQYGLPIIARDIPVFREVAGEHAFYFDGRLPEDLAAAIKAWLKLNADGRAPHSDRMPWLTWKQSAEKLLRFIMGGESLFEIHDSYATIGSIPFEINFRSKRNNSRSFVEHGLSNPEPWGAWSSSKQVKISFNFKNFINKNLLLKIKFNAHCVSKYIQIFEFILNGHLLEKKEYKMDTANELILDISNFVQKHNELIINIPNAISPYKLGTNNDIRELGIGLISMELI
jgi:glycosyltransferase involved in cell wall biosynthesis